MSDIRKPIHDKLVEDFSVLTYNGSTSRLFTEVRKAFVDIPARLPVCEISLGEQTAEFSSFNEDERVYSFISTVFDVVDSTSISNNSIDTRIDRLSRIEDRIMDYLQKVKPNNLDGAIAGVDLYKITVRSVSYDYLQGNQGMQLIQSIVFDIHVIVDVYNI